MDNVKILEVKQSIFASNDEQAAALRAELKQEKIFLLNLMSAPGSGKTTTLRRTIAALQNELRIGVMEADIDSDVDARAIAETGAKAIQLHTGGMCHLDAEMTRQGLAGLGTGGLDLVILENVGRARQCFVLLRHMKTSTTRGYDNGFCALHRQEDRAWPRRHQRSRQRSEEP